MTIATLVEMVQGLIRTVAQPTFVQTVMRVALAVPSWRPGVLKWDGFLQLNDIAITLFTDEFTLAGRPLIRRPWSWFFSPA
ncbi:hypothetical protein EV131_1239 [Rhizobium laguerreae]|uniref:Uncharacterized protein n=1 Tax=Rhizobium laguerreae TaxID=1076926 RepID=A0AAX2QCJ3_9HYPH|nr:hypothetical protein EV131_1239 [Rhizobium laguerreae]